MAIGFDFGTTNSLISVVVGSRVINIFDDEGLPIPSVIKYDGVDKTVGRDAKESLDSPGVGVHGGTVRSPKFLLGDESVFVGGVERHPVDIVADVVKYVKSQAKESQHARHLDGVSSAVVTIPVTMDGYRRAALRDAFSKADIGIIQFVHEPLAALYGYVRGQDDPQSTVNALNKRNVLVVDWGGGTLDLTLCRIHGNRVLQIRNGGSAEIGGDQFDTLIRDEVITRAMKQTGLEDDSEILPDARLRLLHSAELNKIELSSRDVVTFFRPKFFGTTDLNYRLSREELESITAPLINAGLSEIEALLKSVNLAPSQVALCLVAGGMSSMPSIRARLNEFFGPQRVIVPENNGTLISEGAAWIAADGKNLQLAKSIELQLSRGSYVTLLNSGTKMPSERKVKKAKLKLYCTDPSDGFAKFQFCTPTRLSEFPQNSEPRSSLGNLTVKVDPNTVLFRESIDLDLIMNDDLVLELYVKSSDVKDVAAAKFFDLEFGIELPAKLVPKSFEEEGGSEELKSFETGSLLIRSNISIDQDEKKVPGEILFNHNRRAFYRDNWGEDRASDEQLKEYLYYQPCAVCGRPSSDIDCRCDGNEDARRSG